jgi:hypothetical protein
MKITQLFDTHRMVEEGGWNEHVSTCMLSLNEGLLGHRSHSLFHVKMRCV